MKMDWEQVEEAAGENSNQFFDPMAREAQRKEDRKLQKRYDQLCGPVTVRRIGETDGA